MLFKPKQKKEKMNINLFINNYEITQVNEVVFLGVVLDQHLSWKPQIAQFANKISKSIEFLSQVSIFLKKVCIRYIFP